MINEIIKLLPYMPYGENDVIDMAKGKNQLPTTFKEFRLWLKRK
jgi:hypothetical protein